MAKLKKFEIQWTATVTGTKVIEAFDEQDAEDQFDPHVELDDMDEAPMHAEIDFINELTPKVLAARKRKK